ncbi:MAG TPA: tetratricopeptide repeat protein [Phycisphaerae bacterium]|nr:tetratricopeptide repeat protein [Phycisphaerae bacterium]
MTTIVPLILWLLTFAQGQSLNPSIPQSLNPLSPGQRSDVLQKANAAFEAAVAMKNSGAIDARRLFREALDGFQSLVRDGVQNGRLHYNIANTYLRLGDIGRAIANYRRAQRLLPGDEENRKNLEFARSRVELKFAKPAAGAMIETLFFWHYNTSLAARTRAALFSYALFWALALSLRLLPRRPPGLGWALLTVGLFTAAVGASAAWQRATADRHIEGVLIADHVVLRKGNGEYYDPQFDRPLPQGVEFRLRASRPDVDGATWYHIELPDGKDGWLRAEQAEII